MRAIFAAIDAEIDMQPEIGAYTQKILGQHTIELNYDPNLTPFFQGGVRLERPIALHPPARGSAGVGVGAWFNPTG